MSLLVFVVLLSILQNRKATKILLAQKNEIDEKNSELLDKNEKIKTNSEELKTTNKKLKELNETKNKFFSRIDYGR